MTLLRDDDLSAAFRVLPRGQTSITRTFVAQAPGAVRDQA